MPRVPTDPGRRFIGSVVPAPSEAAIVGAGVAGLAQQAQQTVGAFAFERAEARRGHELARNLSVLSQDLDALREQEKVSDPVRGQRDRFDTGAQQRIDELMDSIDDRFVRDRFLERATQLSGAMSIDVGHDEFRRESDQAITQLGQEILPGYARSIVSATNDIERENLRRDATAAVQLSDYLSPEQKQAAVRGFERMVDTTQAQRWLREDPQRLVDMRDDPTLLSRIDPDDRERLINAGMGRVQELQQEQDRGLRLQVFDQIRGSSTGFQLDRIRSRVDSLVQEGRLTDAVGLSFAREIETRRDAIQGEVISLARVSSSLQTGIPMDRTDPGSREAVDVWYQLAVSSEPDPETAERKLADLVTATQIIPGPVISDLRRGASSSDPGLVAAASTQFESLRQSAPVAAAEQMKGPEFRLLRQMDDALAANEQPGPTLERLRASRQQPESVLKLRREQLRVQRQEETDAEWLDGNSEVLAQEVPGWFNNLNPRDGFPPEFQARYSQLVEEMYLESDDLPFARKSALERMGVTWGVTGVGGNRGLIVPLAPERVYRLQTSEIENELLEDLIREGTMGQDGLRLAALVGEGLVEQTEEGRRALLARVLLRTDLESAREIDPETGSFAPRYSVYVTDEEGRNPEMVWTPEGLPFRFSPTRAAIDPAGDPERIEAARVSHRALTDRLGARTDDPAVPEMLVERGFPLGALRVP